MSFNHESYINSTATDKDGAADGGGDEADEAGDSGDNDGSEAEGPGPDEAGEDSEEEEAVGPGPADDAERSDVSAEIDAVFGEAGELPELPAANFAREPQPYTSARPGSMQVLLCLEVSQVACH